MERDWSALLAALPQPAEPASAAPAVRDAAVMQCRGQTFDVAVVGAGINGAAAAAALAQRGLRVVLLDRGDIAGETSMASGNAIWGGFKYLADGQVRLVRTSCRQRANLARVAPHLVRLVEYLMPAYQGDPYSLTSRRLGTWVYHVLGGGRRGTPRPVYYPNADAVLRKDPRLRPQGLLGGVGYHEAEIVTSDAHFTLQFVLEAMVNRATVVTHAQVEAVKDRHDSFELACMDRLRDLSFVVSAKRLVNAAGPWAEALNRLAGVKETRHGLVHRRGTFLIACPQDVSTPDVSAPNHFLTFFCKGENRPFFMYPWGPRYIIGTTDVAQEADDLERIEPSAQELDFMLRQVDARLLPPARPLAQTVIETRVGVRPLAVRREKATSAASRDALSLSREHAIDVALNGRLLVIYGGKLTPCRAMAQQVVNHIAPGERVLRDMYGAPPGWGREQMMATLRIAAEGVEASQELLSSSLAQFGIHASQVIRILREDAGLARRPYPDLPYCWADLVHNARNRYVMTLDDLLRRRTNIAQWIPNGGLGLNNEHEAVVREIARLVAAATHRDVDVLLEEYRRVVAQREGWRTLLDAAQGGETRCS